MSLFERGTEQELDENYNAAVIGKALMERRIRRGLTMKDTSDSTGLYMSYLSAIESGRREIRAPPPCLTKK